MGRGALIVQTSPGEYVRALFSRDGITEEPVNADIAIYAASLPSDFHGDPADRIIVATAAMLGASLVTRDERILSYLRRTKVTPVIAC